MKKKNSRHIFKDIDGELDIHYQILINYTEKANIDRIFVDF